MLDMKRLSLQILYVDEHKPSSRPTDGQNNKLYLRQNFCQGAPKQTAG
jgi:hypothetical protein